MLQWNEILIRLALAAFLGALIGLERERKDWAAGMRTHMLICVGSALTMLVSAFGFADILGTPHVELDPSRIAAQVISGIGFIGVGTILFLKQGTVRGLTTAAGIWTVAAIGLATGAGMFFAAGVTTFLAIVILWILHPIEKRISKRFRHRIATIKISDDSSPSKLLKKLLQSDIQVSSFSYTQEGNARLIEIRFEETKEEVVSSVMEVLQKDQSVDQIIWNK